MDQPKTLTVPEAGRVYFSLGRNASYEAARRGDIPTIQDRQIAPGASRAVGAQARGDRKMKSDWTPEQLKQMQGTNEPREESSCFESG